ncbi:hypothetical protein NP233_g4333 [Leucocoprinus birnbaumii]|uniref:Uncharacterized protein n=1 Tax=Leucocoprinus birnbaumii TaxID=56174 RepID=A0AAD5YSX9_9AGAR|nr:hypothetical protein NP233_g4333 [Leucocoprinus birnbaumii]
MLIGTQAREDTSRYLQIVSIFLESAAINVPTTMIGAVGFAIKASFGTIIAPVAVVGQVFASIIVIHQVAVGRAFSRRREEEMKRLTINSEKSPVQSISTLVEPSNV